MALPSAKPLTVEVLYGLPDDGMRYELVEGNLLSEPLPGARHGRIAFRVARLLSDHVERNNLGEILVGDPGFILARSPDTVRGPDVSFVSRERYDAAGDPVAAFPGAPDLAVEVISPSNRTADVRAKVADYLAAGTRAVWLVDPGQRTVTEYRRLLEPRVLDVGARIDGGEVLPGFESKVKDLF